MGVYIKNLSLANWKELLMWARIGANNAMIGELTEVEEVPPHGDLIDRDTLAKSCADDTTHDVWGAYANEVIISKLRCAPTIIPAEEGE